MKIFRYRILNHVLFWIAIFTFYTIPYLLSMGFVLESFVNLLYIPVDIIGVYFVIEFLIPRYVFQKRRLYIYFLGTAVVIALNILISQYIKYNIQPLLGFSMVQRPFQAELFYGLLNNFMIIGTATALKLFSYSYSIQLTKSELERKTVQSELEILRSQVNPHFLFNVLNNIDALIFEDREKASQSIFLLSKIMRYMLQESAHEKVNLDREIEYIKDYLELTKLSFNSPHFLKLNIQGSANLKEVPPLLFIPIIENAVKHCNKKAGSPGIEIDFTITDNFIELKTSNVVKSNNLKLPVRSSGTGLKNVEKRLKLIYGENYNFEINKNMDKFEVHLKVPLKTQLQ